VTADPWDRLAAELDRWAAAGRTATFWWRDDDAVAATPALDRLLALRKALSVPLTLAVIPEPAEPPLADRLAAEPDITVAQHGFAHRNHAPEGAPKRELGDRALAEVTGELQDGWRRLASLFPAARPVMVPPWNRIDGSVTAALPALGYRGLSTFAARVRREAQPGLVEANTHIDIVDWPGTRRFVGDGAAIGAAAAHLAARREGVPGIDRDEPTGLLTHHLAHDEPCWEFVNRFVARSQTHPAVRWIDADEAFGTGP
jgi:hypothetical protein